MALDEGSCSRGLPRVLDPEAARQSATGTVGAVPPVVEDPEVHPIEQACHGDSQRRLCSSRDHETSREPAVVDVRQEGLDGTTVG
jgi:hypothetical protein